MMTWGKAPCLETSFNGRAVTRWQERDQLPAEDRDTQAAQPETRLVLISLGAQPITSSKLFI